MAEPIFWRPPPVWTGRTAVVLATGPSVTAAVLHAIALARIQDRCRIIAINDAVLNCWMADVAYAADAGWWHARQGLPGFHGRRVQLYPSHPAPYPGVELLERMGCESFDPRPGRIHTHGNTGAQGVQLAAHLGAAPIVLVGFDMRADEKATHHYFGAYPEEQLRGVPDVAKWIEWFGNLAAALPGRIVNATPGSALTCVPFVSLSEVL